VEQATRPQTIGQSLADSPVGLAAWLLDHDAHTYEKMVRAFEGHPDGELKREQILDDIMLYWVTQTETSAARLYWETKVLSLTASESTLPVAMTVFPDEYYRAPRSWLEQAYPNVVYFNEVDRGGHFAAWEQPELFSSELRAAFRSLR
jgi:pimeloyl-ACP methyl ester carboxylesterase